MTDHTTLTDRQWLWRLHGLLAVTATKPAHHEHRTALLDYLRSTCPHDWEHVPADQHTPNPTGPGLAQCRQCCLTRTTPETTPAPTDAATEDTGADAERLAHLDDLYAAVEEGRLKIHLPDCAEDD